MSLFFNPCLMPFTGNAFLICDSPTSQQSTHLLHVLISNSLAFGDSYTYVQGTSGRQNYSFIGDLQNYSFAPEKLLSDEIVQNQVCVRAASISVHEGHSSDRMSVLDWHFGRRA